MTEPHSGQRGFIVTLLIVTLAGAALILSPFSGPILFSLFLAVALYPAYERLRRWMPKQRPSLHAALAVLALVAFLALPLTMLGWIATSETQQIRENANEWRQSLETVRQGQLPPALAWLSPARTWLAAIAGKSGGQIQSTLVERATGAVQKATQMVGKFLVGFLGGIASLFFLFLTLFFFFRDGPAYYKEVRSLLPLDTHSQDQLFDRLQKGISAIIRGWAMTILAQGSAATLGFLIVGARPAVLLGLLAGFAGILPIGGTGLIWGPVALTFLATGSIGKGIFLLLWGGCMVGLIDNLLAPYLIGNRMHMPLIFLLFGILGGTATLGAPGLFLGPLLLSVTPVVFDIYRRKALPGNRS